MYGENYSDLFSDGLASSYAKPTSNYGNWNYDTNSYDLGKKSLDALKNTGMFDTGYKLPAQVRSATSYTHPVGDEPSFLDGLIGSVGTGENGEGGSGLLGGLSNRNLMSGVKGLGNLGLGLASYFQMAPMYEQQLKSMKLANKDMEQSMARQQATRTGLADAIAKSYG